MTTSPHPVVALSGGKDAMTDDWQPMSAAPLRTEVLVRVPGAVRAVAGIKRGKSYWWQIRLLDADGRPLGGGGWWTLRGVEPDGWMPLLDGARR